MTTDAKLGLLAGVLGVVMVAVVYFPKPVTGAVAGPSPTVIAGADSPPDVPPATVVVPGKMPVRATVTGRNAVEE